jgi:F0F1-type ATP synthase membrane subunit b/b'
MAQTRSTSSDFTHAFGDAKKQASGLAGDASDAAQDLYDHARDSAAELANGANRAARQTAGSFERALRNTIETQPYTAVVIALGLGWLFGRMHRPL